MVTVVDEEDPDPDTVEDNALSCATESLYHLISYGCTPPLNSSSIEPSSSELHPGWVTSGVSPTDNGSSFDPSSNVTISLIEHPAASVTVTV